LLKNKSLLAGSHCLVVEDEFLIALDLQQLLESASAASITCFTDAEETLQALRDGGRFDLGVLDVNLGGATRTSLSVADALTAQKTPFVFLTGMQAEQTMTSRFPQVPILEKPYQHDEVLEAIRSVLKPG
jgi:CheY-like chemotaxis protein